MNWSKIALVMRREYLFNFRRPAFLFTAFGVPLLSLGAMFIAINFIADSESNLDDFQQIAYVDRAAIIDPDGPNPNNYQPVRVPGLDGPEQTEDGIAVGPYYDELEAYAAEQLQAGEIDAYFVLPHNYTLTGRVDLYAMESVPEALRDDVRGFLADQIATNAPDDLPVPPARLTDLGITLRDLDSGDELTEAEIIGRFLLPVIFVLLYFMATNTTAQFLMSGVVEEKENRLMEILATSLKPIELLWGKLLGLGALALTQVVLWASAGLVISTINDTASDFLSGAEIAPESLALVLGLFLINFFLFASIMLGVGASVTAEAESRQFAGIFSLIMVLPFALLAAFLTNPNGPLPLFFTFFPLTGAMGLMLRIGLTNVPIWQIVVSAGLQVLTVLVVMWLAAKIFRLGMLMYGKRLTPKAVYQALREGRATMTTASTEYAPADTGSASQRAR